MADLTLDYIKQVVDRFSTEEQLTLIEHLVKRLRETHKAHLAPIETENRQPRSLRGLWEGKFPPDFDLDAALYEIRHEWEKEWPEVFEQ